MADRTLEIVAQIRDMASSHLRRIGAEGKAAGDAVRKGLEGGTQGSQRLGENVFKMGAQFQGLRKVAGGALAGIGAGMAAAQASSENFGQAALRIGTSLATGFAAGGPVGAALTGVGILIGEVVGHSQKAEEEARKVAEANAAWAKSIREITDAYREQEVQHRSNMTARRTGEDPGLLFARWQDQQAKDRLEKGTPDMPGLTAKRWERIQKQTALQHAVEDAMNPSLLGSAQQGVVGQHQEEASRFGWYNADQARRELRGDNDSGKVDAEAAARALTRDWQGSSDQKDVRKALDEYLAALEQEKAAKEAIAQIDKTAAAREADAADAKKRAEADALKALQDQADAMGRRLTASEEDLRFEKEIAMAAALRAKGDEASAEWLEAQVKARKAMDADKAADEQQRKEDERTQQMVEQADQRERFLRLSKEDQAISNDLFLIEDLRKRGETERADTLEKIVRQRQAEAKAEQDAAKAQQQAMRDEADLLAAQRDLIEDKWEREKQAARDRAKMAVKGGKSQEEADKVLALELERITRDQAQAKADVNKEAEREIELLKAATDYDRQRLQAQHEYLDNLEKGVDKKTAELLLAQRLADVAKQQAADEEKAAEAASHKERKFKTDKHGRPIKPFSEVGPEAQTKRDKEARRRHALGLPPVVRLFGPDGPTEEEWAAQKAAKAAAKAGQQPAAGGDKGGPVQQQAQKVQQAVEDAAKKIPDLGALPDPTPFIKKAGDELGKVPPAFDKVTKATNDMASKTTEAVEQVGKAAAKAVEDVASAVRDLKARVRRVEDRLAAAGKGGV